MFLINFCLIVRLRLVFLLVGVVLMKGLKSCGCICLEMLGFVFWILMMIWFLLFGVVLI